MRVFNVRGISERQSAAMHLLRGGAALLVLLEHCKNRVMGPETDFMEFGAAKLIPRVVFNLGHEAVVVFFILSGYLVGRKMFEVRTGDGALKYFVDRLSRIYIVAVPALIFSWAIANILMVSFGISYSQPDVPATCQPSFAEVIANLALMNKIVVPTICSNSPFWSIQNEMSYYAFFGLIVFGGFLWEGVAARLASLLAGIGVAAVLMLEPLNANNTILYAGFWLAGAIVSVQGRIPAVVLALIAVVYGALIARGVTLSGQFTVDLVVAIVTLVAMFGADYVPFPQKLGRFGEFWSEFSYSLYLFHMPVVNALVTISIVFGVDAGRVRVTCFAGWGLIVLYAVVALIFARLMFHLFEARTYDLRRFILSLRAPRAA